MMKMLFRPVDIAALAFFRICYGILGFADIMGSWFYKHFEKNSFDPTQFQFKYYGFQWVKVFSEPWMSLFFIITALGAVGIALGKWYRWSATVFALGFTYTFFMEKGYYLNHGYLMILLSWLMIFLPADREWSAAILKRPNYRWGTMPYWPLFFLRFMMGVVYTYGGIAKLNRDWLQAQPLKIWMGRKADMPILGKVLELEATAYFMSYGGLLLDLFVVWFLMHRRTRVWALGFVIFFHTTNLLIFKIGVFPFLSVVLTLLFFPPDSIRRWLQWRLPRWLAAVGTWPGIRQLISWLRTNFQLAPATRTGNWPVRKWQPLLSAGLGFFMLLMLLLPFRHHLFPGDVAWTEEGHRYSWRMMLRSKRGSGTFRVEADGETFRIRLSKYLSSRLRSKMLTHPDMILQFAHHLRDEYLAEGYKEVAVYADIRARLNQYGYQTFIDPEVDLAKVEWQYFRSEDWIVPYTYPERKKR